MSVIWLGLGLRFPWSWSDVELLPDEAADDGGLAYVLQTYLLADLAQLLLVVAVALLVGDEPGRAMNRVGRKILDIPGVPPAPAATPRPPTLRVLS